MNRKQALSILAACCIVFIGVLPAKAVQIMQTANVNGLRIELHVMEAEPFYTADQVKADSTLEGMLTVGGAAPLQPNAMPAPNCHLIVHVYDAQTGKALTDAKVSMKYQQLDADGKPTGMATEVPVTVMQVIGKGPGSTHYGNNVILRDGTYVVNVTANGKNTKFRIVVPSGKQGESGQ